jgi:hypothetical protein
MPRRLLSVFLGLGVLFGFGSGFASLAWHARHGGGWDRGGCHGRHGDWGEEGLRSAAPAAPQAQPQTVVVQPAAPAAAPAPQVFIIMPGAAPQAAVPVVAATPVATSPAPHQAP